MTGAAMASPTWSALASVKKSTPPGPVVIQDGEALALALAGGRAVSLTTPVVGLIEPIWFALASANQRLPSAPATMPYGPLLLVGIGNSMMPGVDVVSLTWAIRLVLFSVSQRLPSGPV